ncbi:hypothetical protein ACWEC4_04080, partial [Streptomyces sp. NPDC005055]
MQKGVQDTVSGMQKGVQKGVQDTVSGMQKGVQKGVQDTVSGVQKNVQGAISGAQKSLQDMQQGVQSQKSKPAVAPSQTLSKEKLGKLFIDVLGGKPANPVMAKPQQRAGVRSTSTETAAQQQEEQPADTAT